MLKNSYRTERKGFLFFGMIYVYVQVKTIITIQLYFQGMFYKGKYDEYKNVKSGGCWFSFICEWFC